jgi:hypothetical protein
VARHATGEVPPTMRGVLGEHGWGEPSTTR